MKKTKYIIIAVLTASLTILPVLSNESFAATNKVVTQKPSPEKNAETAVKSLEIQSKKLNSNIQAASKNFSSINSKTLANTKSAFTKTNKLVKGLKRGTVKTKLTNRVKKVSIIIENANKFNAAKLAGGRINQGKNDFVQYFDSSDLSYSSKYLNELKSILSKEVKYFNQLDPSLRATFNKKYYDPAYAYVLKYQNEVDISLIIDDFNSEYYNPSSFDKLRKQYKWIKDAINKLPDTKMKTDLKKRFNDIIGIPEKSLYQNFVDSPDTKLRVSLNSLYIGNTGNGKKYSMSYVEENDTFDELQSGQFKVYFSDGTSKIINNDKSTFISAGQTKEYTLSFETNNPNTEATLLEYGIGLNEKEPVTIRTLIWNIQAVEPVEY
ncbi:hypothetical protein NSQ59_27215 [Margalitia sp. FSL K6-0131]|uniref:hypothetical protein n=1 Tax=Margalitia sp. FSL K6-0131 TaxID=2954604 RepID=UPI0030F60C71